MTHPLLYTYRRCPYAMRARMALLQAGVAFDAYEIVLRYKPAEMLQASPKGTVPVLALPDGSVLEESLHIMRWAFEGRDPSGWWDRAQSANCQVLADINDGPFKALLDRYKYPERFPECDRAATRDDAVKQLLDALDRELRAHAYLGGAKPCAADLAIFPFIRQFRGVDEKWFDAQSFAATQQWLRGWVESEMFQRCMRKLKSNGVERF